MLKLWLWRRIEAFLAGGGCIMCRVSSKDLYLAQSLKHLMEYPFIHLLVCCNRKFMNNPSLRWRSKSKEGLDLQVLATEALKCQS
jgi:hypothetical protein